MARRMISAVELGAKVRSSDGQELGTVKEIAWNCFKVGRTFLPAYWLSSIYVDSISRGVVHMRLTKQAIEYAKVEPPGAT